MRLAWSTLHPRHILSLNKCRSGETVDELSIFDFCISFSPLWQLLSFVITLGTDINFVSKITFSLSLTGWNERSVFVNRTHKMKWQKILTSNKLHFSHEATGPAGLELFTLFALHLKWGEVWRAFWPSKLLAVKASFPFLVCRTIKQLYYLKVPFYY